MQHASLALGRWFTLSLAEQLGNVGSEFERSISAQKRGDTKKFHSALLRFYELMDLTVSDPRWQGVRRQELCRVREFSKYIFETNAQKEISSLQRYFYYFALAARVKRL